MTHAAVMLPRTLCDTHVSPPACCAVLWCQVDDMLAQAQSVSRSLLEQRRIFSNVQDKLVTVGERFPVINGLLNAVRRKKSKVSRSWRQPPAAGSLQQLCVARGLSAMLVLRIRMQQP